MKILAVDDEIDILDLIPKILHAAGFPDVTTAKSGLAALDILQDAAVPFDCFCLDINMPVMHGIELCRRIRAIPDYNKSPIIMLTAMTDKEHIDRAFQAGASDYATKPFDFLELRSRLRSAEEVVVARKEAIDAIASKLGRWAHNTRDRSRILYLSDPTQIDGVEDLVDYTALGNYLGQLSRAGVLSSQVIAVKVDRADAIFSRSSAEEWLFALTEVAAAIRDFLKPFGCLMAYVGKGVFVVIAHRPDLLISSEIEAEIQGLLDDRGTEYDNGDAMDIDLSIGSPIRPNAGMTQWFNRIFERAIVRAENRASSKANAPAPPGFRFAGQ